MKDRRCYVSTTTTRPYCDRIYHTPYITGNTEPIEMPDDDPMPVPTPMPDQPGIPEEPGIENPDIRALI